MLRRAAFGVLVAMCALSAFAATERPLIITAQDHSLIAIDDCAHFHTRTITSFPAEAQSQEQRMLELSGLDTLRVRASEEGGISIRGWDRPVVRLTVCKYAVGLSSLDAQKTLHEVAVFSRNGDISAIGPQSDQNRAWWVHMILRVPKSATLDLASSNGGIAIRDMRGHITARATNGGISLASCAGDNKISTENGGISLHDILGITQASTQHGPISLRMESSVGNPFIEARTADAGEILCRAKPCVDAQSSLQGTTHVLRLGGSNPPTIRLSTLGAPILIEQVR